MARDRISGSLRKAPSLGNLGASPLRRTDALGIRDTDLYHIRLDRRSSLTLDIAHQGKKSISGIQLFALKRAKSEVMRSIGRQEFGDLSKSQTQRYLQPIARSSLKNRQQRSFSLILETGEYYLRLFHQRGNTSRYQLNVTAAPALLPQPDPTPNQPSPIPSPNPSPVPTPVPSPIPIPAPSPLPIPDSSPNPSPSPSPNPFALTPQWLRQWGGTENDYAYDTAIDADGNIYVAGVLGDGSSNGNGFVAQYSSSGVLNWQRILPITGSEVVFGIAVDISGHYYVAGAANVTTGNLPTSDGFVAKYNSSGNELWRQTINSTISLPVVGNRSGLDAASGIAITSEGDVLIAGFTGAFPGFSTTQGNGFIAKYNGGTGALITEFGTGGKVLFGGSEADAVANIVVDSNGNIYITGITNASLTTDPDQPYISGDAYVAAYNATGNLLWQDTLTSGATQDYGRDLAVSGNRVYITGQTAGRLPGQTHAGGTDGLVASYNRTTGDRLWVKQFGTPGLDEAQGIAVDQAGNLYLTGETTRSLFGNQIGGSDAWVAQYDNNGNVLNGIQIGTAQDDETYSIQVIQGNVYVVGQTLGTFPNQTQPGGYDVWVAKYAVTS